MNRSKSTMTIFKNLFMESFKLFNRNNYEIILLATIPFTANSILYLYFSNISLETLPDIHPAILFILGFLFILTQLVIYPIVIYMVKEDQLGHFISAKKGFVSIKNKLPSLSLALLLYTGLMFLIGIASIVLISFYGSSLIFVGFISIVVTVTSMKLLIDFLFYQQEIIIKNKNPIQGFKNSRNRTKIAWWRIFYLYLLLDLVILLILNLLSPFIGLVQNHLLSSILLGFIQALGSIFTQIFITLMFIKLEQDS